MGRFSQVPTSSSSSYGSYDSDTSMTSTVRRPCPPHGFPKKCFCGLDPVLRTSTTVDNPGRRFYGCRNFHDGGVHLMKWWDEAMMEEFVILDKTVAQICANIDHIYLSYAENQHLSKLQEDVQKTKAEIAHLKELLIEKPPGEMKRGVELKKLMLAGLVLTVLIISISLCL